jgi:predicted PurR-regulated permease PerM
MPQARINSIVLISLAAVAAFLCFMMIRPFMKPIVFAVVFVILFYPLHLRILKLLPYPNGAALISTLLVVLLISVLVLGLGGILGSELKGLYVTLAGPANSQIWQSAAWFRSMQGVLRWANHFLSFSGFRLETSLRGQFEKIIGYFLSLMAGAFGNIASLLAEALAGFFILFFLFRDGTTIKGHMTSFLPSAKDQFERLFRHIDEILIATVYGTVAIAATQGALTGVAFWVLGLRSPVLWGAVTGVFALIPVIGTGFVWIPAAVILALAGHVGKAVAMVLGSAVVRTTREISFGLQTQYGKYTMGSASGRLGLLAAESSAQA